METHKASSDVYTSGSHFYWPLSLPQEGCPLPNLSMVTQPPLCSSSQKACSQAALPQHHDPFAGATPSQSAPRGGLPAKASCCHFPNQKACHQAALQTAQACLPVCTCRCPPPGNAPMPTGKLSQLERSLSAAWRRPLTCATPIVTSGVCPGLASGLSACLAAPSGSCTPEHMHRSAFTMSDTSGIPPIPEQNGVQAACRSPVCRDWLGWVGLRLQ